MKLRQIPRTVKFTILLLLLIGSVCIVTQPSPALAATDNTHATSRPDDLYPQAVTMPDFSKITLTWQGNGFTRVEGIPGAIPGAYPVYVVSPNTAYAALTKASSDGSFSTEIVAPPGSWVIVKYDPLNGRWLERNILYNERPHGVNAAPGSMAQVPFEPPSGDGVPFVLSGSTFPGHLDFTLSGLMKGQFRPGGSVSLSGTASVYVTQNGVGALTGQRLNLHVYLIPLFDTHGRSRMEANQFFSNILTPSGLPVEHWGGAPLVGDVLETDALQPDGTGNRLTAQFSVLVSIPYTVLDGTYGFWLSTFSDINTGSLGGPRPHVNPFMANHALPFPPFTVGEPAPPHLIWTLLTDVPSADGSRGTVAVQDAADFQIANRIATQSHRYVIPRLSKETGQALTYRLEPYLPMVAHGDRYIPNVPNFTFKLPSGSLRVQITHPDGAVDTFGPTPFTVATSRTPTSSDGSFIDFGGGHLAEVFQLSTGSGMFDYQFPLYGEYTIEMTGTVEDVYGNVYEGGGTYTVFVAEPLDIEPATLPMTPFEVGDVLNPGITVLPGVPAKIEVKVTLLVESDPDQKVEYLVSGTANRFGTFTPPPDAPVIEMIGPGELLVETTAHYTDGNGVLWMGATRWGQVVAPPDSSLIAHGRRGRDDTPINKVKLWFNAPITPGDSAHINLPFARGDILWQTNDDAARVIISVQDTEGLVEEAIRAWDRQGNYHSRGDHGDPPPTLDQRARAGELPLTFATRSGLNPALDPSDIVTYGYWYSGIERPGERVREIISDDDVGTGYWRFNDMYAFQPGMGANGDMPNDFKFQFGGAVFRDTTQELNRYGIYGSLWVMLADNDRKGSRVFPPFQGANGGPSGGPIMTLAGEAIDAFVVPLAVRPGTILEAGDSFSFAAQLAPTLPAMVDVTVTGPDGFSRAISGRANAIGYFYEPARDFVVTTPGIYHVSVTATFDSPTSAGPMTEPYPTGTVLGASANGFDVYVVSPESPALSTTHPAWSVVRGFQSVPLQVSLPQEQSGTIYYTIGMPGFLLESGTVKSSEGWTTMVYDPARLSRTFPNIDAVGRTGYEPGLADTVWVNILMEGEDGNFYARQFTLQGPDLIVPPQGSEITALLPTPIPPIPRELPTGQTDCLTTEVELFASDFESGTNGWEFNPPSAWSVVEDSGSKVLLGKGHVHAYANGSWDEVVWRLRVKLESGRMHLNFHDSNGRRYLISFADEGTQLIKFSPADDFLDDVSAYHSPDEWHMVEISLLQHVLRISVDGVQEIVTSEPDSLAPGGIWLEVLDGSSAKFDDIHICEPSE